LETLKCEVCGATFTQIRGRQKYCSRVCYRTSNIRRAVKVRKEKKMRVKGREAFPSQNAPKSDGGDPFRNLWSAVIGEAVRALIKKRKSSRAIRFFSEQDGMFTWICGHLSYDPQNIRDALSKKYKISFKYKDLEEQKIYPRLKQNTQPNTPPTQ
jgi:hypothetical protein